MSSSSRPGGFGFPDGRRFAFTVFDDTDVSTLENIRPVYDYLTELGMRTTKTVWPLAWDGRSAFTQSETMQDEPYLEYVQELDARGFEITWHCASMESSKRERSIEGLETFRRLMGYYPRTHANHSYNRENLYWGRDRLDIGLIRRLYSGDRPEDHYQGHVEGSEFWWGDLCQKHFDYVRNLTYDDLNLAAINPSMPYRDPNRPLGKMWFSATDGPDVDAFNHAIRSEAQEMLAGPGGFTIVATHFGKGFVRDGELNPDTRRLLAELADRGGWFPTVSELLDHLVAQGAGREIPRREWSSMQWRWFSERILGRLRARFGR